MPPLNSAFDPDIDSFLDLDQASFTPSSASPDLSKAKAVTSSRPSEPSYFASSQSQQTFSGPSFQYDNYRQQTGLPVGGLANTFALNQATGMQYTGTHYGFVMPTETLNMPMSSLGDFDFARPSSLAMSDMDFENDSPSGSLPTMFYPPSSSNGQFVNPTALVGQEDSPTDAAPARRMYPGMHTQQAAQAKAQQAQRQQEMARQQQQRQIPGQKPLPTQPKSQQKDPLVEESISRLLQQMRQNSVASVDDDDAATPTASLPNISRLKKEEDEMDADERLLASEEGKKLSSKERRQLRNKVSARAFRSRRKEYIGQLEGEVAAKAQEASDLRAQNRQLIEENTRLTDLTRMLLSSQAFSSFLNELSQNGTPAPATAAASSQPQPQPTKKDVNPHQATRQAQNQQTQVGMTIIPETTIDFSALDSTPTTNWAAGFGMNSFQVCSVTELPEGPAIDTESLSGKKPFSFSKSVTSTAKDYPVIEFPRVASPHHTDLPAIRQDDGVELDEAAFTLFFDQPRATAPAVERTIASDHTSSNELSALVQTVTEDSESEEERWKELESMCAALDATCEHLFAYTSHIS